MIKKFNTRRVNSALKNGMFVISIKERADNALVILNATDYTSNFRVFFDPKEKKILGKETYDISVKEIEELLIVKK